MRIVRVDYHREMDGWWAESPDVAGFSAAGDSLSEVRRLVREGIAFATEEQVDLVEAAPWPGAVFEVSMSIPRWMPQTASVGVVSSSQQTSPVWAAMA